MIKTNEEYFMLSQSHAEPLFDPFYAKNVIILPNTKEQSNNLTEKNEELIELITTFGVLYTKNIDCPTTTMKDIVNKIIIILDSTKHINYSAFTQFFMVYNSTFSVYQRLKPEEKEKFITEMLIKYYTERHKMYLSHGYSNIILQVMCDNYSHKRNSKTGIEKFLSYINPYGVERLSNTEEIKTKETYYFLPDKGDKNLFENMLQDLCIKMESRAIEQKKLPDIVLKHNNNYYICELKTMKGLGGGQNKQIVEIANFIRYAETDQNIHYVDFIDCDYANIIFNDNSAKVEEQRNDIMKALKTTNNYFLNTYGLKTFIEDLFDC